MTNATPNDNRQSARELWNSLREEPRTELERRGDLFHLYNEFLKDESDNWECSFCQGAVHNTEPDYVEIRWDETYKLWGIVVIDNHPVISGPLHDRAEVGYFPTVNERGSVQAICSRFKDRSSLLPKDRGTVGTRREIVIAWR